MGFPMSMCIDKNDSLSRGQTICCGLDTMLVMLCGLSHLIFLTFLIRWIFVLAPEIDEETDDIFMAMQRRVHDLNHYTILLSKCLIQHGSNNGLLMDTWLDGNENLLLLAPVFSLAQKWGGGRKQITVLLAWFSCFIN